MSTTKIGLSSEDVLRHCRALSELQQELIAIWRQHNAGAVDLEMLLDFKRETIVVHDGVEWTAKKHGVGVRFDSTAGTTVDIPFGIDQAQKFDPNRTYDYLVSLKVFEVLQSGKPRRNAIYATFDDLEREGKLRVSKDASGRSLYELA